MMRFTMCLLLALALVIPVAAARKKSDPGPHPLKVLKAKTNARSGTGAMNSAKGDMTIWIQNTSDVLVDKVRVELEIFGDSGRMVEKKVKEVGNVEPGSKHYVDFRWDVLGEKNVDFQIWIYYNGGLSDRLTQFEGEPPVW